MQPRLFVAILTNSLPLFLLRCLGRVPFVRYQRKKKNWGDLVAVPVVEGEEPVGSLDAASGEEDETAKSNGTWTSRKEHKKPKQPPQPPQPSQLQTISVTIKEDDDGRSVVNIGGEEVELSSFDQWLWSILGNEGGCTGLMATN